MTTGHQPPQGGKTFSEEQQAIIDCRSDSLRVLAFAGTGKTTTMRAYARARPQQRMLYLAFNRAVAAEARESFPETVSCSTIHGLAYRSVGHRYRHQLRGALRIDQVVLALALERRSRKDLALAQHALAALQHFLCSGSVDLPAFAASLSPEKRYPSAALEGAARLWALMGDPCDGRIPMLHDGYLKLYQLSSPKLRFDVILLDEAQDTNPVTLAILEQQHCAKVLVGDPHQQIYQFRHATNAMAAAGEWDELALTGSFRFGETMAEAANRLLALKGETRTVRGLRRSPAPQTRAFIARGNAALFKRAVDLAQHGTRLYWCGGLDGYRHDQLLDLWHLRRGEMGQIRDRFLAGFQSYGELAAYADEQDVRDLKGWCALLEWHPHWERIPEEIAQLRGMSLGQLDPGVCALATAHKSKGLEFGAVTLADDFHAHALLHGIGSDRSNWEYGPEQAPALWDEQGYRGAVVLPEEELNLRYVALTRAQGRCSSPQWSTPLFDDLAEFIREYPRFLLVNSSEQLKAKTSSISREEQGEQGEQKQAAPPAASMAAGAETSDRSAPLPLPAPRSQRPQWFLGSLDGTHLRIITSHYARRYPALNWDWLLQQLAEQRLVTSDPITAVEAFVVNHHLDSAQALIERFLQDLALVVQPGEGVVQQDASPDHSAMESPGASQDAAGGGKAVAQTAPRSVGTRLASLWWRSRA